MSVLSYLQRRASDAVLSVIERSSITTSITTLQRRLGSHFGADIQEDFRFGSSTRETILPRAMDENSDIDYMIVFAVGGYTPQTYLDRLRRFVSVYYSSSEIYQSNPTIVLEMNHIKFDLVPAVKRTLLGSSYDIPSRSGAWQSTNPNDFNQTLEAANARHSYRIKPTIRLAKLWNAANDYVFDSFMFEKWIIEQNYFLCANLQDYLFAVFDALPVASLTEQWRRDKVERAKRIVAKTRELESGNMPYSAEAEVKKLVPE